MKLGIPLLVIGILMLIGSIFYSILSIIAGVIRLTQNDTSGGFAAYSPLIGVVIGFVLTAIGVTKVFGRPR